MDELVSEPPQGLFLLAGLPDASPLPPSNSLHRLRLTGPRCPAERVLPFPGGELECAVGAVIPSIPLTLVTLFTKATLSPEHHQLSRSLPDSGEGGWTYQQFLFLALPRGCFPSRVSAPTRKPWILRLVPLTVKLSIASRDLRATRAACLAWGEKEATGFFS